MRRTGNHGRCPHCRIWFKLEVHNRHSQRYCNSTAECRCASRCAASEKYRIGKKDEVEFRKAEVERVQGWRGRNPGYSRKSKENCKKDNALRDIVQGEKSPELHALRDIVIFQKACFQGLVSLVTGALRDDIGMRINSLYDKGIALSKEGCATFNVEDFPHETEGNRGSVSAQARA